MKRLIISLVAAALAATPAGAVTVRYDFSGTVSAGAPVGPAGAAFAAEVGAGAFSGHVAFDTAAPDLDPAATSELYDSSDFALSFGSYAFSSANVGSDFAAALIDLGTGELLFNFASFGDFSPLPNDEFLNFNFAFLIPGLGAGIAQSPAAPASLVDFAINSSDGFLLGDGSVATISTTVSAIPEPGAWVLMICGFGLIGGALRLRAAPGMKAAQLR